MFCFSNVQLKLLERDGPVDGGKWPVGCRQAWGSTSTGSFQRPSNIECNHSEAGWYV